MDRPARRRIVRLSSLGALNRGALNREALGHSWRHLRGLSERLWPAALLPPTPSSNLLTGDEALSALYALAGSDVGGGEAGAARLLEACAASLSLYPAWERRDWRMPGPGETEAAYGGAFLPLPELALRVGGISHQEGRPSYLHRASGLAFALYRRGRSAAGGGELLLLMGGTNTSHSDRQVATFPAEAVQFRADLLNAVGGVPRLFRAADLVTALVRSELGRLLPDAPLTLAGHSLGAALVQYAAPLSGLPGLAFSPSALGRGTLRLMHQAGATGADAARLHAFSLDGDPIPLMGTRHLHTRVLGRHLRLPLHPDVPPSRHATSHGQVYAHLLGWLRREWPGLGSALGER